MFFCSFKKNAADIFGKVCKQHQLRIPPNVVDCVYFYFVHRFIILADLLCSTVGYSCWKRPVQSALRRNHHLVSGILLHICGRTVGYTSARLHVSWQKIWTLNWSYIMQWRIQDFLKGNFFGQNFLKTAWEPKKLDGQEEWGRVQNFSM